MKTNGFMARYGLTTVILLDIVAGVVFCRYMPLMRRPFEMLLLLITILAIATAAAVKNKVIRGGLVVAASVAASLFGLEMAEKYFNITNLSNPRPAFAVKGKGGPYSWTNEPGSYFAAKDKARRDGVEPEALEEHFAGDIFAGMDPSSLATMPRTVSTIKTVVTSLKPLYRLGTDLGYEHTPDNLVRDCSREESSEKYYFDGKYTIDSHGLRVARGDNNAEEAYLFIGDSFTFGAFLSDDETTPYHFNRGFQFTKRVVNAATQGWGPHQSLRDLQLNSRVGPALGNARVKGAFYGLIDDHSIRCSNTSPRYMTSPYYVLHNDGTLKLTSRRSEGIAGSLSMMMQKSRIYPVIKERLELKYRAEGEGSYKWRLTMAILAEIDRVCRERYGVPLTVVYWDGNPDVSRMVQNAGLNLVRIEDALPEGDEWKMMAIKYLTADGHPSAFANKKLAEHLFALQANLSEQGQ